MTTEDVQFLFDNTFLGYDIPDDTYRLTIDDKGNYFMVNLAWHNKPEGRGILIRDLFLICNQIFLATGVKVFLSYE